MLAEFENLTEWLHALCLGYAYVLSVGGYVARFGEVLVNFRSTDELRKVPCLSRDTKFFIGIKNEAEQGSA